MPVSTFANTEDTQSQEESDAKASGVGVRVVSANLHVAAGAPPMPKEGLPAAAIRANLDRIAALLGEQAADVILLQEVDFGCARSGGIDQGAYLARALGMHLSSAVTLDTTSLAAPQAAKLPFVLKNCRYGLAILSRQPPLKHETLMLPNPPETPGLPISEARALLSILYPIEGQDPLTIANTHLNWLSRTARLGQLLAISDALPVSGWVLGGDFNEPWPPADERVGAELIGLHDWDAWPQGESANWREDWPALLGATRPWPSLAGSYPAKAAVVAIDHIFAAGRARLLKAERIKSGSLSDHHFTLADIRVRKQK